jgi:hypothetical protein
MDRATRLYWLLVALLLGSSAYFAMRVVERDLEGGSYAGAERSP